VTGSKKLGVDLLVVTFYWSFARLIAPLVTTTSITLSFNKIQNGDILVPANPGSSGKWLLKRQRDSTKQNYLLLFILNVPFHHRLLQPRPRPSNDS